MTAVRGAGLPGAVLPATGMRRPKLPTFRCAAALAGMLAFVGAPAWAQQPAAPPPGLKATTNNPNLSVATLKLDKGERAGKIIGAGVYLAADPNEQVGSVDDLILTDGDKATVAVISVGGVLGLGAKLIAVPFEQLKRGSDKLVLTGVTRDELNNMPSFQY